MNLSTSKIQAVVQSNFCVVYKQFKEFAQSPQYAPYWAHCMAAISDGELLAHIIFCNDVFAIPPIKTYLTYYKEDFIQLTGDEKAVLDVFVKKSIGAFWGMVFKIALGYHGQKSVSVSMYDFFVVKTATYFIKD